MRNEEMTRGKKLAMLFFLAVAAAFMLSFARPQAAQAKTIKVYVGKKNKTITLKEGTSNHNLKFVNKKGKTVRIKKKACWDRKKTPYGFYYAASFWGTVKYSETGKKTAANNVVVTDTIPSEYKFPLAKYPHRVYNPSCLIEN